MELNEIIEGNRRTFRSTYQFKYQSTLPNGQHIYSVFKHSGCAWDGEYVLECAHFTTKYKRYLKITIAYNHYKESLKTMKCNQGANTL